MSQKLLKVTVAGLLALSVGTAGAVATEAALVVPKPLGPCPSCNVNELNCRAHHVSASITLTSDSISVSKSNSS